MLEVELAHLENR